MNTIHIHIVGPVGCGKSAMAGEIEILCKANRRRETSTLEASIQTSGNAFSTGQSPPMWMSRSTTRTNSAPGWMFLLAALQRLPAMGRMVAQVLAAMSRRKLTGKL